MDSEKSTVDVERLRLDIAANIKRLCQEEFPSGKKIGHEWCVGDVSGDKGKSLKIELEADGKQGFYHDWATGQKGDFIKLLQERFGIGFREVTEKIGSVLGINYLVAAPETIESNKSTPRSKASAKNSQQRPAEKEPAALNWSRYVMDLTNNPDLLLAQAAERKWTNEFFKHLLDHELIGSFRDHLAFPSWRNGSVIAVHYERYLGTNGSEKKWFYDPKDLSHGAYTTNNPKGDKRAKGASRVIVSESYWDLFAYLDLTGLYLDDNIAGICTRGAEGTGRLAGLISEGVEVIVLPQNDTPGQGWLQKIRELIGRPIQCVRCPSPLKDFSDWRKAGATIQEIDAATVELEALSKTKAESLHKTDEEQQQQAKRELSGQSLYDYAKRQIDLDNTLLGNRWLCSTNGAVVVSPSGMGKSSLSIQAAILWSCDKVAFGIKPARPLRILIVQAEDDDDDTTEMCQMLDKLGLTPVEKELVHANTSFNRVNDCIDMEFLQVLESFLAQAPFDLVILNPLSAYTDPDKTDKLSPFLRRGLNRLMKQFNVAVVLICHTPKTQFQKDKNLSWYDWCYIGAGRAELTNWARAVLVLWPMDEPEGTFEFIAAKRGKRIGWTQKETYWSHADDGEIIWKPAGNKEIEAAKASKESKKSRRPQRKTSEMLLKYLSLTDWLSAKKVSSLANRSGEPGISERRVPDMLEDLVDQGKAEVREEKRPRTNALKLYRKLPSANSTTKPPFGDG
jgi:RecA-family ATPase